MPTYELMRWSTPASKYPRIRVGAAAIETHFWEKGFFYEAYGTRPPSSDMRFRLIETKQRIKMTNLTINRQVVMVDDVAHWWSIQEHAALYEGHVLVAGLGLGLIVYALAANPKVKSITVIEREPDVIELVGHHLPKCKIVCADWDKYKPRKKFDGVFFDLFVGEGKELFPFAVVRMIELRERFPAATCRILGFPNETLLRAADQVIARKTQLLKELQGVHHE